MFDTSPSPIRWRLAEGNKPGRRMRRAMRNVLEPFAKYPRVRISYALYCLIEFKSLKLHAIHFRNHTLAPVAVKSRRFSASLLPRPPPSRRKSNCSVLTESAVSTGSSGKYRRTLGQLVGIWMFTFTESLAAMAFHLES